MKILRLCRLIAFLSLAAHAPAATLIDRGDAGWRWRPGITEASTPVTAWRTNGYNDSDFVTAPAPFWYGDVLPGGTQITGMQNVYLSIFLRKTFVITNLAEVGGLRMTALVDDGFVAWINGSEVLRVQVPGTPGSTVTISTLADNAVEPVSYVTYNLPTPPTYLIAGTNVIAVQVFQSALSSSDLGFDTSLESIVTETNPPTILSVNPAPGTVNSLSQITVTFSEPVSGVVSAHLFVGGMGATDVIPVNSSTYTYKFVQPPYGPVPITWNPAHTIVDQALPPNRFNATGPGATWTYTLVDNTPPLVAALSPGAGTTVRTLASITVIFSEPVSGVGATDLLINDSPASGITPTSESEYVFSFSAPPTGVVQVAWAQSHGIVDQEGNPFAGGFWTYHFDPNAAAASPYISEFMASNTRSNALTPFSEDWIEIYNPSPLTVNLEGWYLTDSEDNLKNWRFPATNLAGGGFLVVLASGKDQRIPGRQLHTSFQLNASGEYLALVNPDGVVVSDFPAPFAPQVPNVSYGFTQTPAGDTLEAGTNRVYFTTPTPGAANLAGTAVPGPIIDSVRHTPNVPLDQEDLVVTARVQPSFQAVASVTLRYRIMFSNELSTPMLDDGAHGDGAAGDGVYGATIPASLSTNGQMIRYLVAATDVNARSSRWPLFTNPTDSAGYLGTMVNPTNVTSLLPIFHLFASNSVLQAAPPTSQIGADSETGGRVAIFYDGEFYDNVYMELRGNTSAGQQKKSHRLEFTREHTFRHLPEFPRVRKTSLMAEYLDPAYIRQHLSFWLLEQMGMKTPFFYPVRAQLNGSFYGLVFHSDVIDLEQVERMGYDPSGALYKAAGNCLPSESSTGVFQKKSPPLLDHSDYQALVRAINETNTPPGQATNVTLRRIAAYDRLDIPEVINYLAGARWCAENDDVWANMSLYRDTTNGSGDGLWRIIPFDMNASWGQRYGGITPLDAIADTCKSHPLYGGSTIIACDGSSYNRIYDTIIALPETRQMLLRRQRTVLDRWVMEPGVPAGSRLLETHIRYMTNLIWTEAFLDRAKWGYSTWAASNKPLTNAITELFNEFINLRRIHWSVTHNVTNVAKPIGISPTSNAGIPLSQPPQASLTIAAIEYNPASGNQSQEYLCITNPNPFAVDISDWKLGNGVNFTFRPGTVVPSNNVLYVSPSIPAFRARTTGPRGGQGLFVVGPYKGQLSARGEALTLHDDRGRLVYTNNYPGSPSLAQQYLRVTEIMYNPAPLVGSTNDPQQFEYLELKNISPSVTLDLNGVRFINALSFGFTGSAITSLAPGQRVLVVRNLATFAARYGGGLPVAGQYVGALDSSGERIQLVDASGEEILDFTYNNSWYAITDGLGFSLAIVGENADPDAWSSKTNWWPNGTLYGTPGQGNTQLPDFAPILITEVLTHTDPPLRDTVELWNPTTNDVNLAGWFLSDDFGTPKKYQFPADTMITAGGYLTVDETLLTNAATALIPFAFRGAGDEAWIYSGDATTNLTGYAYGEDFGAAANGVSFGRYTNSVGKVHFVAQAANSLGSPNSAPRVGPVVISEILYHPPDLADGSDDLKDEYVELRNITANTVPLYDTNHPANTWRLRGGADLTLPPGLSLAGGASLLLVNFDPADVLVLDTFRARYGISPATLVLGPYSGKLNNDSDDLKLEQPSDPDTNGVPYILIDRVAYEGANGWPAFADGGGGSLQRINPAAYGNDPINWAAAAPSAGGNYVGGTPPTITVQPANQTALASLSATFSVTASPLPLRYQWRLDGVNVPGGTNSVLQLDNLQSSQAGTYSVIVFNGAGSAVSSNATLNVQIPATILVQPQPVSLRGSTNAADYGNTTNNATFTVLAAGTGPVTYQWRFNGAPIPGAIGTTFTVTNVQLTNEGNYDALIHDDVGTIPSAPARLSVLVTPAFVQVPLAQTVPAGSWLNLSTVIQGNPTPFGYQWRSNSVVLPLLVSDSRTNFFSIRTATNAVVATYRLVVTNAASTGNGVFAQFNITTVADTDLDGLPDSVEISLGLDPNDPADGAMDLDEDGASNRDEYIAGTNPNDENSYLRIDPNPVPGMASVKFTAVTNRTYSIQYTDQLPANGPWTKLADFVARTTNRVETVIDPGWTTNRFYRIALPAQSP